MNLIRENNHWKWYEKTAAWSGGPMKSYTELFLRQKKKMNVEYSFMRTQISGEKLPGESSSFILSVPGEQKTRHLIKYSLHDYLWAMS